MLSYMLALTARSRKRTLGTPTHRLSSVVGMLFTSSPPLLSHAHVICFIDSSELGPGTILGPAGLSSSTPAGPSTVYSPVYPSSSLAPQPPVPSTQFTASLSYTVGSSSNTTTSTPGPVPAGYSVKGHSSNTGAIAGGTVAGIAAISIVVVTLFFYRQRRRSLAQSAPAAGDGQTGAYYQHVDQVPSRPMSGQGTVTSSLPGTSTSILRAYVRSLSPAPCLQLRLSAHLFFRPIEPGRPIYVPRVPRSSEPVFHFCSSTFLIEHQTSIHYCHPAGTRRQHRNMRGILGRLLSDLTLGPSQWPGLYCASVFSFPSFHFRGCGCEWCSFPFFLWFMVQIGLIGGRQPSLARRGQKKITIRTMYLS